MRQAIQDEYRERISRVVEDDKRSGLEAEIKEAFFKDVPELAKLGVQLDVMIHSRSKRDDINRVNWFVGGGLLIQNNQQHQAIHYLDLIPQTFKDYAVRYNMIAEYLVVHSVAIEDGELKLLNREFESVCGIKNFESFKAGWLAYRNIDKNKWKR